MKYLFIIFVFLGCQSKEVKIPYCVSNQNVTHAFTNDTSETTKSDNITVKCLK